LKELAEKLSPTDPSLSVIINAGSNAAMWAHLPDEQEKWDRKELELVRANADYSDTWLMEVICELAGDLLQQGGKDKLNEAETLVREGLAVAQVKLNDGNESTYEEVRNLLGQLSLLLARILIALGEPEKAHAEINTALAFYDKIKADLGPLNGILNLQDAYHMLLGIAKQWALQDGKYADAQAIAIEATEVLHRMFEQAPEFMPQWLESQLELADGHERIYQNMVDNDSTAPLTK